MKVLLDSHAVYWWMIGSDRLSTRARSMIEDKANVVLVSAVSFYELDNKMRLKKLDLKPQETTRSGVRQRLANPCHHRRACGIGGRLRLGSSRSWDRILAAQTRLEHCAFVSTDSAFDAVLHERVW